MGQLFLVSVIIPNFNHAAYLTQRIESVINQSYSNIEVIILDDCSTDNSREIIEQYRGHPLVMHIVYNSVNSGSTFKQWQKGLQLAKGEWVWIAESDDYASRLFLETMLSSFKKSDRFGLLYCDSHVVMNESIQPVTFSMQRNIRLNTNHWSSSYANKGLDEIEDYLLAHGTINNTSAVIFNRSILVNCDPFDVPFRFMGDKYAFIKVLSVSDVGYVNQPLNYYRAATNAKPKHTDDYFDYFYEHFLIFDWVDRNLKSLDCKKVKFAIEVNAQTSFFFLTRKKIRVLSEIFKKNKRLLWQIFKSNVKRLFHRNPN